MRSAILSEDSRSGLFVWDGSNLKKQVALDPKQGVYIAPDTDPSGASGAWVRQFKGGVSPKWFGAIADGSTDDGIALQAAIDYAVASNLGRVELDKGHYAFSATLRLDTRGITITGFDGANRQFGSAPPASHLIWIGGKAPMMQCSATGYTFRGFGVENRGNATDWLELNSGAQAFIFDNLYFIRADSHTAFSRSIIRSNGNRIGYSRFNSIYCRGGAPVFLDVHGGGTSNGVTPVSFGGRSLFESAGAPLTVLKVTDETIEHVLFEDCTFIMNRNELAVVDTTTAPLNVTIQSLCIRNCEYDVTAPAKPNWRWLKLTNVRNITFDENVIYGAGTLTHVAALSNSNITSCNGNYWKSLKYLFDADPESRVSCGTNFPEVNSVEKEFSATTAGIEEVPYSATPIVDLRKIGHGRHGIYRIDVTDSSGYDIRLGTTKPYGPLPGTVFTVHIRNRSGGVIAPGVFNSTTYKMQGALRAPADGFGRLYTFYFDGTVAIEISRSIADVPNT